MSSSESLYDDIEDMLQEEKFLTLTRNEALYLSDSVTVLLEHVPEAGRIHSPSASLVPSATVSTPIETIQKIGMACLESTDPNNFGGTSTISLPVSDLYLLRECCKSYAKVGHELVGFNLLRKIYHLILENDVKERELIDNLTKEIDIDALLNNAPKKD